MSVGHQLNGVEVKLCNTANSDSKEICFRGRNIFMGYLHDEGKTMEIMDKNGWLHTGDLGYADNDGKYIYKYVEHHCWTMKVSIILLVGQKN